MVHDILFNQYISLYVIIPLFLEIGLLLVFCSIVVINTCQTSHILDNFSKDVRLILKDIMKYVGIETPFKFLANTEQVIQLGESWI